MNTTTTGTAPAILRPKAAAAYLGVSLSFLYAAILRREITKIKLGERASGIRRSDLDAWIEAQAAA